MFNSFFGGPRPTETISGLYGRSASSTDIVTTKRDTGRVLVHTEVRTAVERFHMYAELGTPTGVHAPYNPFHGMDHIVLTDFRCENRLYRM